MILSAHIFHTFADTSRHYLPVDVIKQVIESMSYAKLVRYVTQKGFCTWIHLSTFLILHYDLFL